MNKEIFIFKINMSNFLIFKEEALKWISQIIAFEYPIHKAPKWINYMLFHEDLRERMMNSLVTHLGYRDTRIVWHELPFQYVCENIDIQSSSIQNEIIHMMEMEIPKKLIQLFQRI
jgi:hypothetical protein